MPNKPPYNLQLDKQFRQLGFSNYRDMLDNGLFLEKWMSLSTKQFVIKPPGNGSHSVRFLFTIDHQTQSQEDSPKDKITMIAATLEHSVLLDGMKLKFESEERLFGIEQGPLPTKDQIIDILEPQIILFQKLKNTVKRLNMEIRSQVATDK